MLTRRGFLGALAATPLGVDAVQAILNAQPAAPNLPPVASTVQNVTDLFAHNITDLRIEAELEDITSLGDAWTTQAPTGRRFFETEVIDIDVPEVGSRVRLLAYGRGFTGRIDRTEWRFTHGRRYVRLSGDILELS